jgi:cytochrome c556
MRSLTTRTRRVLATALAVAALGTAPMAVSHLVEDAPMHSYRQSFFTLLYMNFGPIGAMMKGDIPWDEERLKSLGDTFAAIASTDVTKAFPVGSDKGTTRAKPGIWENKADFKDKFADLQAAALVLKAATASGDKAAVGQALKQTGGACKACHDEYKNKDYLY